MKVIPLGYRLLVKKDEKGEVTQGGIIIAKDTVDREYAAETQGTVIAVGTSAFDDDDGARKRVQKGTRVLYRRYAGVLVEQEDTSTILINDKDVVAIVQ